AHTAPSVAGRSRLERIPAGWMPLCGSPRAPDPGGDPSLGAEVLDDARKGVFCRPHREVTDTRVRWPDGRASGRPFAARIRFRIKPYRFVLSDTNPYRNDLPFRTGMGILAPCRSRHRPARDAASEAGLTLTSPKRPG